MPSVCWIDVYKRQGLNLTAADIVIHYDPWWNVAAQNQATDRAYRIGQRNPVPVSYTHLLRFIAAMNSSVMRSG